MNWRNILKEKRNIKSKDEPYLLDNLDEVFDLLIEIGKKHRSSTNDCSFNTLGVTVTAVTPAKDLDSSPNPLGENSND
jgi:hypothetical protein